MILVAKSKTDKMRVYDMGKENARGYRYIVQVNSLCDGDPAYGYKTKRGALVAMARFEKNRYTGKPSTTWE